MTHKHNMTRRRTLGVLAILLALVSGCGRDGSSSAVAQSASPETSAHDRHDDHDHDHAHGESDKDKDHDEEITLTSEGVKKAGIQIALVRKHILAETIDAPARVAFNAEAMAHVGSPLPGRISELKVKVGDTVAKGDALLIVQSPELAEAQSDYLLKRMGVETAAPAVELAKAAHARAKALFDESQGIALTEVQRREAEYNAAVAAQLTAQAQASAAENRLHLYGMDHDAIAALSRSGEITPHYIVRAPINGQVIEREATLGELVNPDRDALLVLADMNTLWVLADVPESRIRHVVLGAKAQMIVAALPQTPLEGKVSFIAAALDPNTRTVSVRIEVSGKTMGLRPGMFARAIITQGAAQDGKEPVLAIPEEATQLLEGELVVFVPVEGEQNTYAKRPITVGPAIGRMLPVNSGLKENDKIVVAGSFILKAEHGKGSAGHEH